MGYKWIPLNNTQVRTIGIQKIHRTTNDDCARAGERICYCGLHDAFDELQIRLRHLHGISVCRTYAPNGCAKCQRSRNVSSLPMSTITKTTNLQIFHEVAFAFGSNEKVVLTHCDLVINFDNLLFRYNYLFIALVISSTYCPNRRWRNSVGKAENAVMKEIYGFPLGYSLPSFISSLLLLAVVFISGLAGCVGCATLAFPHSRDILAWLEPKRIPLVPQFPIPFSPSSFLLHNITQIPF